MTMALVFLLVAIVLVAVIIPLTLHGAAGTGDGEASSTSSETGYDPLPSAPSGACSNLKKHYSTRRSDTEEIEKRNMVTRFVPYDESQDVRDKETELMKHFYSPMNDPYFFPNAERYAERSDTGRRRLPKYTVINPTRFQMAPRIPVASSTQPPLMARKLRQRTPHAMFVITYVKEHAEINNECTSPSSYCFDPMAEGAIWKSTFDYVLNTENDYGISAPLFKQWVSSSFDEWDNRIPAENIVGGESSAEFDGIDALGPDGKNEITFGGLDDLGVLGVATVWGYFEGPIDEREIIECDITLNSNIAQSWGDADQNSQVYDVRNILRHEIGHCLGAKDLYDSADSELTMYGFAALGETKKRTVETCEINGAEDFYVEYRK